MICFPSISPPYLTPGLGDSLPSARLSVVACTPSSTAKSFCQRPTDLRHRRISAPVLIFPCHSTTYSPPASSTTRLRFTLGGRPTRGGASRLDGRSISPCCRRGRHNSLPQA